MPGLDFLAAPNGLDSPRLGMIVPKKIIATAVGRNRVKRLIREAFRHHQSELAGLDVVARIRSIAVEKISQETLKICLSQCKSCIAFRGRPTAKAVSLSKP
jgi:ribonuclease P protein component